MSDFCLTVSLLEIIGQLLYGQIEKKICFSGAYVKSRSQTFLGLVI